MQKSDVPASLRQWAHLIEEIEDYRCQGPDGDGYWCHLAPGWRDEGTETHSVHEDNISQCVPRFRHMVRPCSCAACLELIANRKS